jgi:riboflavin synthase
MFTGIVEDLATLISTRQLKGKTYSLLVDLNDSGRDVCIGDSIAVNGVCLTIANKRGSTGSFQVIKETLNRTNLGKLTPGSKVNIERSMTLNQRISGHIVMGHIDGTGTIRDVRLQNDGSSKMEISADRKLTELMVEKGAVALDGVSLTLVDVSDSWFSVCLIPHTLKSTNLCLKRRSDLVNVEADYIGKYILKFASNYQGTFKRERFRT